MEVCRQLSPSADGARRERRSLWQPWAHIPTTEAGGGKGISNTWRRSHAAGGSCGPAAAGRLRYGAKRRLEMRRQLPPWTQAGAARALHRARKPEMRRQLPPWTRPNLRVAARTGARSRGLRALTLAKATLPAHCSYIAQYRHRRDQTGKKGRPRIEAEKRTGSRERRHRGQGRESGRRGKVAGKHAEADPALRRPQLRHNAPCSAPKSSPSAALHLPRRGTHARL